MKKRYFLLSALAAAAVMPGTASANLVLDMPPILAGNGNSSSTCNQSTCTQQGGICCGGQCQTISCTYCCNNQCQTTQCTSTTSGILNDTGITAKQANYDDSQFGRDAAILQKIGSGHAGFDFSTVSGNCIKDNATGLLWSPDQGSTTMSYSTAQSKAGAANTNSLCGQSSGWRVPNLRELLSLVAYDVATGKMIDSIFSDTQPSGWYWTATASSGADKWGVNFSSSTLSVTNTLNANSYLRLVNGTELKGSFTPDANGYVTDGNAKLTWKRCLEGQTWDSVNKKCIGTATLYTWANALSLTANGWRLPNIKELQSSTEYFPNGSGGFIWSASPYAGNTNNIWVLNTSNGTFANNIAKTLSAGYVRLVKDAQ